MTNQNKQLNSVNSRRDFLQQLSLGGLSLAGLSMAGCVPNNQQDNRKPSLVWSQKGLSDGRLMKPRAITVDATDQVYVVDMTGRIQVFDHDGKFLRGWRTPMIEHGKPVGMQTTRDGKMLIVADTHYFRILWYTLDGTLDESKTIGGINGDEPGQFHFVTDVVQTKDNHLLAGQYGQADRIQEFDPDGKFVRRFGTQGRAHGEFSRPQSLLIDDDGLLWIADACNHRIQVYDLQPTEPKLEKIFGSAGSEPGQLQYPYGIEFDFDGTLLVVEYGNHRVQRFSRDGESLEIWGTPGKEKGQFISPWDLAIDSKRRLHVLDSLSHRVQSFQLS